MNRAVATAACAAALAAAAAFPAWAAAAPGTVTDTSTADFAAGTPGTTTAVVDPGSVQLAPVRYDFDGDTLPDGFTWTPWATGGTAAVADGELTVDGAQVVSGTSVGQVHSLAFRAVLGDKPFVNIGFANTFNDGPWATFSTGAASTYLPTYPKLLWTRTANAGSQTSVDRGIAGIDITQPHTYRIDWDASQVRYYVDGQLLVTVPEGIPGQLHAVVSDFDADGNPVTVDWLEPGTYQTSGAFDSRVLDAGGSAAWGTLTAAGSAGVSLQTRTGDTPTPDASWSDFTPLGAGGEIAGPAGRYLQYRATLTTADATKTPSLDSVVASYDVAPATTIDGLDVTDTTATARFSSAGGTDVDHFECKLDAGAFAPCESGDELTDLAQGGHTFTVRAVDLAGNAGPESVRTFSVDTIAPATAISGVAVTGAGATVSFSSPDADVVRFECRLDAGSFAPCTSGKRYTGLTDGPHTIAVRAVDQSGNTGAPDTRDFTVDTTAPSVAISSVDVAGSTATVNFYSPDSDVARFACRLDTGAFATCVSGQQYSGLAPGEHTVTVQAVDTAGNAGMAVATFTVHAPAQVQPTPTPTPTPQPSGGPAPKPAGPAPTPAVNPTAPTIRLTPGRVRVSKSGTLRLRARCTGTDTSCRVSVRIELGGRVLARRTITVAGGKSRSFTVRLSAAARRRLGHARRLKATAVVTGRDTAGHAKTRHVRLALVAS